MIHSRLLAQESHRLFQQQAAAVTGFTIGCHCAPMSHSGQCIDGGFDQLVAGLTIDLGNQPEAAVVVLEVGVVQAGFGEFL